MWVVQGLLAVAFLGAGGAKLTQPKEKLAKNMAWVEDLSSMVGGWRDRRSNKCTR